jgi:hypothetical protein
LFAPEVTVILHSATSSGLRQKATVLSVVQDEFELNALNRKHSSVIWSHCEVLLDDDATKKRNCCATPALDSLLSTATVVDDVAATENVGPRAKRVKSDRSEDEPSERIEAEREDSG